MSLGAAYFEPEFCKTDQPRCLTMCIQKLVRALTGHTLRDIKLCILVFYVLSIIHVGLIGVECIISRIRAIVFLVWRKFCLSGSMVS